MAEQGYQIGALPSLNTAADLLGAILEAEKLVSGVAKNFRVPVGVLFQAFGQSMPGPNERKDLRKHTRFTSTAQSNYESGSSAMSTLPADGLCLGCVCTVEFDQGGTMFVDYQLRYDATSNMQVFIDGRFTGLKVPASWVRLDASTPPAGVDQYNALEDRVPQGKDRLYSFGPDQPTRLFEAKIELLRANFGGQIPAPTGLLSDPNWKEKPIGGDSYSPRVSIGQPAFKDLATAGTALPDKAYYLYRANEDSEAAGEVIDVLVFTTSGGSISPYAILDPSNRALAGSYDVGTDTFVIDAAATYVRVIGDPDDKNLVIGAPGNIQYINGGTNGTIIGGNEGSIGGGEYNTLQGGYANNIQGGNYNRIQDGDNNAILGGSNNNIQGGTGNTIPASCSYVTLIACDSFSAPAGVSYRTYINNEEYGVYTSPNGTRWKVTIENDGTLTRTSIP